VAFRFFLVPVKGSGDVEVELNGFLASHQVLAVDRRFIDCGENSSWAICVDYQTSEQRGDSSRKKARID
jgi:hypothetical protein